MFPKPGSLGRELQTPSTGVSGDQEGEGPGPGKGGAAERPGAPGRRAEA